MTLRVVADNVTELPVGNIPAELRNLADVIEAGYYGNVATRWVRRLLSRFRGNYILERAKP